MYINYAYFLSLNFIAIELFRPDTKSLVRKIKMNKIYKAMISVGLLTVSSLVLTACGGGGGDSGGSSTPVANLDVQGFWGGTSSAGYDQAAVILENGELYNIFSRNGLAYGIDYGVLSVSGSSFSGNISEFYIPTNQVFAGTTTGTFTPKSVISGAVSFASGNGTFSGTYGTAYDTPATLAALTGNYVGNYYTGVPVTMAISSTGVIIGTSTNCSFSGTATPRPTGKNVYNVSLTFTGVQCAPGAGSASGIGVLNVVGSSTYLYTAGLNAGKTNGFFWIGRKS